MKYHPSLEAAIILDGFKSSISTHNIIYGKVIGDGDSSVYNKIKDAKPYGPDFFIEKIECRNHILRNFCNKLKEICKLPRTSAVLKNKIKSNILKLRTAIVSAIKYRKNEQCPLHEKIENLKNDILNSPRHILGNHSNCAPYFCTTGTANLVKKMLYSNFNNKALEYGVTHENMAIKQFEIFSGKKVSKCGLFVDDRLRFLAASPDGLVDENSMLLVCI